MAMIVLVVCLVALAGLVAGRGALTIKTTGTPIGASARAGDFIATPIGRLEPYVPSLNRNHGNDAYSIGLLIHSARDEKHRRYVEAAKGQSGSVFGVVKITGVSDDLVYFDAPAGVVVDVRKAQMLSADEAVRIAAPPRPVGAEALAALATAERRLENLLAAPGEDGAPMAPATDEEIFNPSFMRSAPHKAPLSVGGDHFLLYWTQRHRAGTLMAARVAAGGAVLWRVDTGLGALVEILPDAQRPALVGTGPRVAGEVAPPLLVILDAAEGRIDRHSLLVD